VFLAVVRPGCTITCAKRNQGDALPAARHLGRGWLAGWLAGWLEIVAPFLGIVAWRVATVVDRIVDRHGTRALAEAWLRPP